MVGRFFLSCYIQRQQQLSEGALTPTLKPSPTFSLSEAGLPLSYQSKRIPGSSSLSYPRFVARPKLLSETSYGSRRLSRLKVQSARARPRFGSPLSLAVYVCVCVGVAVQVSVSAPLNAKITRGRVGHGE